MGILVWGNILLLILTGILTTVFLYIFRKYAYKLDLVDYPGGHRKHDLPTPLVGGLGIYCGLMASLFFFPFPLGESRLLMAGSTLLIIVGVLDDLHDLSSRSRFGAQIVAALFMSWGAGVTILDLGELIPGRLVELGVLAIPFTVFSTVGVINALNMADGIDGEAAVLSLIALGGMTLLVLGDARNTLLMGMVAITVVVFLAFNMKWFGLQKSVFLGDAGSMYLGFTITWFIVELSQGMERAMAPVTALYLLAVPLYDTVALLFHRMLEARSPFKADRDHLHHVLGRMGLSDHVVLGIVALIAVGIAGLGLYWEKTLVSEYLRFLGFLGGFFGYFVLMSYLWKRYPEKAVIGSCVNCK